MTTYSPTQDGDTNGTLLPTTWFESNTTLGVYPLLAQPAGISFTLPTGVSYSGATLTLHYSGTLLTGTDPGDLGVYLVDALNPAPWSDSNLPTVVGATLVAAFEIPTTPSPLVFDVAAAVLARSEAVGWSGELAFVVAAGAEITLTYLSASEHADAAQRPVLTVTVIEVTAASVVHGLAPDRDHPLRRRRFRPDAGL